MITGYPSFSTRGLVSILTTLFPSIPVYGVCDYDPFGIDIILQYHEICRGNFRWIGVKNAQLNQYLSADQDNQHQSLSEEDFKKCDNLMKKLTSMVS